VPLKLKAGFAAWCQQRSSCPPFCQKMGTHCCCSRAVRRWYETDSEGPQEVPHGNNEGCKACRAPAAATTTAMLAQVAYMEQDTRAPLGTLQKAQHSRACAPLSAVG